MQKNEDKTNYVSHGLSYLIWQTRDLLYRARKMELMQHDLQVPEEAVLFILREINEKATPSEMARIVCRKPQFITTVLSNMKKKGLITKVKDSEKKNQVRVKITEKGIEAYNNAVNNRSILIDIFTCLTKEESEYLRTLIGKVRDSAWVKAYEQFA